MLKNTNTLPSGGWVYEQPGTGWKIREMTPFDDVVKQIVLHRRSNNLPRATMSEAAEDLDNATCQRLGNDPQFCFDSAQKKTIRNQTTTEVDARPAVLRWLSHAVDGGRILKDWLGEGGVPVEQSVAERRAKVCVNDCSDSEKGFNKPPNFLQRVTAVVAEAILEQRRAKTNLALKVENEDKLQTCSVCECDLPLKVWVPISVLQKRTDQQTEDRFPKWCWYKQETKSQNV